MSGAAWPGTPIHNGDRIDLQGKSCVVTFLIGAIERRVILGEESYVIHSQSLLPATTSLLLSTLGKCYPL